MVSPVRKDLSADARVSMVHTSFVKILDHRVGWPAISLPDALMSVFAMFSLTCPSLSPVLPEIPGNQHRLRCRQQPLPGPHGTPSPPGIAGIAGTPGSAALFSASTTGAQNSEEHSLRTHKGKVSRCGRQMSPGLFRDTFPWPVHATPAGPADALPDHGTVICTRSCIHWHPFPGGLFPRPPTRLRLLGMLGRKIR